MILRALAALALGGSLLVFLPGLQHHLEAGQFPASSPEIVTRYRQALATDPGNLTLHYLLGVALLQKQENADALRELQTAYPAYQDSLEANYNLALASLRLGDLVSAEIYLDQAIALGAESAPGIYPVASLYYNMALVSQEHGDHNEAIRLFHRVLAYAPDRHEVYRQLGDLYATQGDSERAIQSFARYLEIYPEDPLSREYVFALEFNRGQEALAAEELDRAAGHFQKAREFQPDSPTTLYYLGYIAHTRGQQRQAAALLVKADAKADINLKRAIRPLLYNTALALRQSGQNRQAAETIALLADAPHPLFNELYLAGTISLDLGRHRAAQEYFRRAIALEPQDPRAQQGLLAAEAGAFDEWLAQAALALDNQAFEQAEQALAEARALQPRATRLQILANRIAQARSQAALNADLDNLLAEGNRFLESDRFDEAKSTFERILEIAPQHPEATQGLDRESALRRQRVATLFEEGQRALDNGHTAQAIAAFDQLLALAPEDSLAREARQSARLLQQNRLTERIAKGRQAIDREQFDAARRWFEQAREIDTSGRAAEELARLDRLKLEKADALARQAELATRRQQFRQADSLYRRALGIDPAHQPSLTGHKALSMEIERTITAAMQQADQALDQEDYATAAQTYRRVLDINPDHAGALNGMRLSRSQQATLLDRMVHEGEEALRNGDFNGTQKILANTLALDPYHDGALQLRQRLEQLQQHGARPEDEQQLYLQGVAFYTQGAYAEAIRSWETVLLLNPEHVKAAQNIAKTRQKLQQIKEFGGG